MVWCPRPAAAGDKRSAAVAPNRIHVQVYAHEKLAEPTRRVIEQAVVGGAGEAGGSTFVAGVKAGTSGAAADKALKRSDKALVEARKRVKNLDDGALDLLDWAADEYSRYLPQLMARDGNADKLLQVFIQSTIVNYLNEEEAAANAAMKRCFVIKPDLDFSKDLFPPQLENFVVQERLLFDELGHGGLAVTVPGTTGVSVYINGIDRGEAPVTVKDLPAGPNIITLTVAGAEPVVLTGDVDGGHTTVVEGAIKAGKSKVTGPLDKTRSDVGDDQLTGQMKKALGKLKVDGLLLVLPTVRGNKVELVAYVYDGRSGTMVGRSEAEADLANPGPEAEELGRNAIATAKWDATAKRFVSGPPIWKRVVRHKYFWPALGATAGVVVIGVLTVAATSGLSNSQKVGIFPIMQF